MYRVIVPLCFVFVAVIAKPADPGYGVVLSAPQYSATPNIAPSYIEPGSYQVNVVENPPVPVMPIAAPAPIPAQAPAGYGYRPHYTPEERALKDAYNRYLDKKIAHKKGVIAGIIGKAIEKTIDLKALLTKTTVDFVTKVAVGTAANLAKSGVQATVHKVTQKYSPEYAYKKY
ncbi:uncharacterized protein LOC143205229 isoform X2 [Rhynchophorus ferrugineus]|uniref:Uncharacterized protein n=1 Tax=Rhynchophorus ferrugineus TaxID=354439 RepID=A0A834IKT9_RHYFE|nr:hypothetical protein GWI33_004987 [Rhynchophorus ferrugineus]